MKALSIFFISVLLFGCGGQKPLAIVTNNSLSAAPATRSFVETASTPQRKTNSAVVISEHANLRQSASQKSDVIDVVPMDSSIEVIKQRGVWFYVKTETAQGWMHGNTLRLERFNEPLRSTTTEARIIPTPAPSASTPEPETNHSGASAKCRDGSLSFSAHRRGTCSHHGGVAEWY